MTDKDPHTYIILWQALKDFWSLVIWPITFIGVAVIGWMGKQIYGIPSTYKKSDNCSSEMVILESTLKNEIILIRQDMRHDTEKLSDKMDVNLKSIQEFHHKEVNAIYTIIRDETEKRHVEIVKLIKHHNKKD